MDSVVAWRTWRVAAWSARGAVLLLGIAVQPAGAQTGPRTAGGPPDTQPTPAAADAALQADGDRLFQEGKRLFQTREFERAETLFRQAGELFERVPNAVDAAWTYSWRGQCFDELTRYSQAEPVYREQLRRFRAIHGAEHPDVAASLNNLAGLLKAKGDYAGAEPLYREALAMRRKLLGAEHPAVATSLNNLALLLKAKGDYAGAESLYREALALYRKLLGAEHPDVATSLNNLAGLLVAKGDYAGAEPLYREALAMRRKLLGAEHPDVAASLGNLASVLREKGDHVGAEPLFREALAMFRKLLGAEHPAVATSLNNLAGLLVVKGDYAGAESLYREALAMRRKLLGAEHPDVAASLNNLASVLEAKGDYAGAETLYREALALYRKLLGAEHPDVAASLNNLAGLLKAKGDYAGAEPLYREALAMRRKLLGAEHPAVATSLNNLALLLKAKGDYAGAESLYREALAMYRKLLGAEHPAVATSLNNLAGLLEAKGDYAGAETLYREAVEIARRSASADLYKSTTNLAWLYAKQDRHAEAEPLLEAAISQLSALRATAAGYAEEERSAVFGHIEREWGTYELMVAVQVGLGRLDEALRYLELSRARAALDVLERGRIDLDQEITRRAAADPARRMEVEAVLARLRGAENDANMLEHALAALRGRLTALRTGAQTGGPDEEVRLKTEFDAQTAALLRAREALLEAGGARFQLLRELVPIADAKDCATIRGLLKPDERILYYNITDEGGMVLLVPPLGQEIRVATLRWPADPLNATPSAGEREDGRAVTERELTERVNRFLAAIVLSGLDSQRRIAAELLAALQRVPSPTGEQTAEMRLLEERIAGMDERLRSLEREDSIPAASAEGSLGPVAAPDVRTLGMELFAALLPPEIWAELQGVRRVYLVPHGALHRLPFEALFVAPDPGTGNGEHGGEAPRGGGEQLRYWLDVGPEIAYVPSGSLLHWLKERRRQQQAAEVERTRTPLAAALLVGDAIFARSDAGDARWPAEGVVVMHVAAESAEARAGMAVDDVVLAYDGRDVGDDRALRDAIEAVVRAVEDGQRKKEPVPVRIWRGGVAQLLNVEPVRWEATLARPAPRAYFEDRQRTIEERLALGVRDGFASRYGSLERLPATRREVLGIAATLSGRGDAQAETLLDEDATLTRVFADAPRARRLHFAVHGLADEVRQASFSNLALTLPRVWNAADNGFLGVRDLFEHWRDHIPRCELVVLSACQTNIGPLQRDEAAFALPLGFFYAGTPTVVASLWSVADDSTATLMAEFYRGLAGGRDGQDGVNAPDGAAPAGDRLAAFTAARRALRRDARYAEPFYWAPFVYIGAPD